MPTQGKRIQIKLISQIFATLSLRAFALSTKSEEQIALATNIPNSPRS